MRAAVVGARNAMTAMTQPGPWRRLASSDPDDLEVVSDHLDALLEAARSFVAASADAAARDRRDATAPSFAADQDPQLRAVARQLAAVRSGTTPELTPELAVRRFRSALTAATDAVGACRRTAHPNGVCWFTPVPGEDGCRVVLHTAHRYS